MNVIRANRFAVFFTILGLGALALGGAYYATNLKGAGAEMPRKTLDDYLRDGEKYFERGEYQEAVISYEKAAGLQEDNREVLMGLGEALAVTQDLEKAEESYRKAMDLGGDTSAACVELARVMISQGKLSEAKELVERESTGSQDERLLDLKRQMTVEAPAFSLPSGSYDSYQLLTLAEPVKGAVVYYTLDGTEPGADSEAFRGDLVLADPEITLTARAINAMGYQSDTVTMSYRITAPVTEYEPLNYQEGEMLHRALFNSSGGRPIYSYDLAKLRELCIVGTGYSYTQTELQGAVFTENKWKSGNRSGAGTGSIRAPGFLGFCPFLKTLNIAFQSNFDISVLAGCTQLEELSLINDGITDISALSSLTGLKRLSLGWNEITDISVLSGMKELRSLGLWNNQISDITPLSGLKELRTLDVSGNQLTDASVCGELPELTELWVRRNRIQDLSFTDRLEDLRVLMAGENPVTEYGRLKIRANDLSFTDLTE
ncbi:MAG: leucine-rich repeat domain-containing protein [Stomatobaculum sp.]|nr:leucine-rich repeat domain-containing protein [Stomatobaculum sp.]